MTITCVWAGRLFLGETGTGVRGQFVGKNKPGGQGLWFKNSRLPNLCQHAHSADRLSKSNCVIPSSDLGQHLRNTGEPESLELPKVLCQGEGKREGIGERGVRWGCLMLAEESALGKGHRSCASHTHPLQNGKIARSARMPRREICVHKAPGVCSKYVRREDEGVRADERRLVMTG